MDAPVKKLIVLLCLISPPVFAQSQLAATSYRVAPVPVMPRNLQGRQGFWSLSTGGAANHTLLHTIGGVDLDFDLGPFLPLAGGTMNAGAFVNLNGGGITQSLGMSGVNGFSFTLGNAGSPLGLVGNAASTLTFGGLGGNPKTILSFTAPTAIRSIVFPDKDGTVATTVDSAGGDASGTLGALTLNTVNSNVGSFTNANVTVDAKGRITAASNGTSGGIADSPLTGDGSSGSHFACATCVVTGGSTMTGPFVLSGSQTGTYTLGGTPTLGANLSVAANVNVTAASGTSAFDWSAGSGVFKTTTGAHTFGSASWATPANTVITAAAASTNTVGLKLVSNVADGASSVGLAIDNTTANANGKNISFRNAGTERGYISMDTIITGSFVIQQPSTTYMGFFDSGLNGIKVQSSAVYIRGGAGVDRVTLSSAGTSWSPVSDTGVSLGLKAQRWGGLFNSSSMSCGHNLQSGTTFTATSTDCWVVMSNAAAKTVTMPAASAVPAGGLLYVLDGSANASTQNISVARAGSDTINGGTANVAVVTVSNAHSTCESDGTSKWICGINN